MATTEIDAAVKRAHDKAAELLPPFAERRAIRLRAGLTLDEMARALGTYAPTMSLYERSTNPRGERREVYARLLARLNEAFPPE